MERGLCDHGDRGFAGARTVVDSLFNTLQACERGLFPPLHQTGEIKLSLETTVSYGSDPHEDKRVFLNLDGNHRLTALAELNREHPEDQLPYPIVNRVSPQSRLL